MSVLLYFLNTKGVMFIGEKLFVNNTQSPMMQHELAFHGQPV